MNRLIADKVVTPTRSRALRTISPALIEWDQKGIRRVEKISRSRLLSRRGIHRFQCVIPGLVDCHTHLVFAGDRAAEWGQRLAGKSYAEIARSGGGIRLTSRLTREASEGELLRSARHHLKTILSFGITSLEAKSGYGLSLASELKILRVIHRLRQEAKQDIVATFMGAHALPPEFASWREYISHLREIVLPQVRGLAEFQDVFVEKGYVGKKEALELLRTGKRLGLLPRVHAHEFGRTGGVEVAERIKAVSADHLMYLNASDIAKLKRSGTIPVVLPGTSFFLGAKRFAPARKLWDAGLRVAIASDFNPGTNPSSNLPLCGTLAAVFQNLTLDEILTAQTYHAALALRRFDRGILEAGTRADFVAIDGPHFESLYYNYGKPCVEAVYIRGNRVY